MAVQIQLRRGTASAWTAANPTLAVGEFAIETDTDLYKIGDGSTAWTSLGYSSLPSTAIASGGGTFTGAVTFNGASPIVFEGATADAYETTIAITDPTAARTITLPNASGTMAFTSDISSIAIIDADSDTKIQVEESADEDIIRFDTAGTERMSIAADGTVTIAGNLTVDGTTTTINSTTLSVDDKNIELGSVASPSDSTADGGGITLKGASDKTIIWTNSTDTWDFNQGITVTGTATATAFAGPLTGNASTATALATARTIGGTSFDGTAAIVPGTITVADTTDTTCNVALFESATGDLAPKTDNSGITYNAGTGLLTVDTAGGGYSGPHIVGMPTAKSSHYTLVLADAGKMIRMNSASANNLTIPNNSTEAFPVGTQILINVMNTGTTTIAAAGGVVRDSKEDKYDIDGRYSTVALIKTETNNWTLTGPLA